MADAIFTRNRAGPILTPADLPFQSNGVFNPGAAEVDGEVVLLLRIENPDGISHVRVARSSNGVDGWRIADRPLLQPDLPGYPFEEWGCEDPRVTQIGARQWLIAYTAYSRYGPTVALAETSDFETVIRFGAVLSPPNKDAALLPEQLDGRWFLLHRPVSGAEEHIWYILSDSGFESWGWPRVLLPQRGGPWWDGVRVGVGAPPLRTDRGWLLIYHGVKDMANRPVYRLGLALLDLADPRRLVARARDWVFAPAADYEQQGFVPDVVYTCGALLRGSDVWMYYGAADTAVGLATAKLADLLDFVDRHDYLDHVGRDKGMAP